MSTLRLADSTDLAQLKAITGAAIACAFSVNIGAALIPLGSLGFADCAQPLQPAEMHHH